MTLTDNSGIEYEVDDGNPGTSLYITVPDMSKKYSIVLPKSIRVLSRGLYRNYRNIKSISLHDKVKEIGQECFMGTGLKVISFPSSLSVLNSRVCKNCRNLVAVYVSRGLKEIGEEAFADCPRLDKIYYPGSSQEWFQKVKLAYNFNSRSYHITVKCGKDNQDIHYGYTDTQNTTVPAKDSNLEEEENA